MVEDIIGWSLIIIGLIAILYLPYLAYRRYKIYQDMQTQQLIYKQKLKEEYLLNQKSVWLGEDTEKKSQMISTDKF